MDERMRFLYEALRSNLSFAELCRRYGISRKTGYKWLNRFFKEGIDGYCEQSKAPKIQPRKTPYLVEELLVVQRLLHPSWGPKKLIELLRTHHGVQQQRWPLLTKYSYRSTLATKTISGVSREHPTIPRNVYTNDRGN